MRNGSYEHSSVETVAQPFPEARVAVRKARLNTTYRLASYDAAAVASVVSDKLLAQTEIETRRRREERRAAARMAEDALAIEIAEDPAEFLLI
ncbi:MAG: hypothetical protein WCP31_09760 [Chloroflexales bacterium]